MAGYLKALSEGDFRRLFIGATASTLGDGMSFVALAWLVVSRPGGTGQLALLVACYTGPVFVGGWVAGIFLDRFDKRRVIAADCFIRGAAFASIPISALAGQPIGWLPFAVAVLYGLLKMIPLAGFPSAIPDLVRDENLDAANALEGLSYGVAGIVGPAAAGLLIGLAGAANVLLVDAATYVLFALAAISIRRPLAAAAGVARSRTGMREVVRFLATDLPIASTTLAFMTANVAEGMLMVAGPWLAREKLGGAPALGLLFSAMSLGELAGSTLAGMWSPRRPLLGIAGVELIASLGFASIYAATIRPAVVLGYAVVGFFGAPMTVWAQTMRMRRLPPSFRGRAFAVLRTFMQATPPLGAVMAGPLLSRGDLPAMVGLMVLLVAGPALVLAGLGARLDVALRTPG